MKKIELLENIVINETTGMQPTRAMLKDKINEIIEYINKENK